MSFNHLKSVSGAQSQEIRRFRWRLTFAKRMLCRNQNRRIARGLPI
jgi:hypothetical protein